MLAGQTTATRDNVMDGKLMTFQDGKMAQAQRQSGLFGPLDESTTSLVDAGAAQLVRVAFEKGADRLFDYAVPASVSDQLQPGQRVWVPFGKGNRAQIAFAVDFPQATDVERVKTITEIIDPAPLINQRLMQLARWMSQYYCASLGAVLSAMVPAAVKFQVGMQKKNYVRLTEKALDLQRREEKIKLSPKGRAVIDYLISICCGKQKSTMSPPQKRGSSDSKVVFPFDNMDSRVRGNDNGHFSQQEVISNCTDSTTKIALKDLTAKLKCSRAPINTLARAGLVEITQKSELEAPEFVSAEPAEEVPDFELNSDQQKALTEAENLIAEQNFQALLLHGVTGSGKTEIYIRCIEKVLQSGRQALVLVPEIALTPQTVRRFRRRFGRVAVLHSGMTNRQRHQHWRGIAQGQAQVVVGARSAVFAPLPDLGLIVVDEEHEPSYKQDNTPRYHGRDVAIKLAQMSGITIILGSATPSLESFYNCRTKEHYHLLSLPRRVRNLPLPPVHLVDMHAELQERKGRHLLGRTLEHEINRTLAEKKQTILLLNRRGHSSYIFCNSCNFVLTCPDCDVSLTYHKTQRQFDSSPRRWVMCHYCSHKCQVPESCPLCSRKLMLIGPGTQQAEEELTRKFPTARACRVDSDSMKSDKYYRVLNDFGAGEIDILFGTQMIGKGLDFPNVKLVGVINADTSLALPDFRSSERTFQLIAQVAGRCGRASPDSTVIVQSYLPAEPAVQLACKHDYLSFARHELLIRQRCPLPPFQRMARVIMRHQKLQKLEATAQQLRAEIDRVLASMNLPLKIRGPFPCPIARLETYYRFQIILQAASADPIQQLLAQLRRDYLPTINVPTFVDVDPINLM
jgi:primosomal protein N' (replication factor Y)